MTRSCTPFLRSALLLVFGCSASALQAAEILHEKVDGSDVILIRGDIAHGDELKFRRLALRYDEALVFLDSAGGALIPAIEIGKAIHIRGYNTVVANGSLCTSACALIWIAGSTRHLSAAGKLGFHASYREEGGRQQETGVGNALVGRYLTLLNLPEKAIVFATLASPDSIQWLTQRNMESSGIDFRLLDGELLNSSAANARAAWSDNEETFGGWNVSILERMNSCLMGAQYENEEFLAVEYDATADAARIAFTNKNATSLTSGDERSLNITFTLDRGVDDGWRNLSFTATVASDGRRLLRSAPLQPLFLADFARSRAVSIYYKSRLVGSFNLSGSLAGVSALKRCARDVTQ